MSHRRISALVAGVVLVACSWVVTRQIGGAILSRVRSHAHDLRSIERSAAEHRDRVRHRAEVQAARDAASVEGNEFLLKVLEGRTEIDPGLALDALWTELSHPGRDSWLHDEPRLERAMSEQIAAHESWLQRNRFARVAGFMRWQRAEPQLRELLDDANLSVRREAAEALETLTGEHVAFRAPATEFPLERPVERLVGEALRLGSAPNGSPFLQVSFARGPDGRDRLARPAAGALHWTDAAGNERESLELPWRIFRVLDLGGTDESGGLVALTSALGKGGNQVGPTHALGLDSSGEIWEHRAPSRGFVDAAPLADLTGPYGVALATRGRGIVALDGEGQELWSYASTGSVYGLSTHPALPGRLLLLTGGVALLEHDRSRCRSASPPARSAEYLHATQGVLFPDAHGGASAVLAGTGPESVPTLTRTAPDGTRPWNVLLPDRIDGLVTFQPEGCAPLFAALTRTSQLFVFDEDGARLHGGPISDEDRGPHAAWTLAAGELDGTWYLAAQRKGRLQLHALDLTALPGR